MMLDGNESSTESIAPARSDQTGIGLVAATLAVPVPGAIAILIVTSAGVALAISGASVLGSAILVAIDAARLGSIDLRGQRRESAGALFLGMCLVWLFFYPFAFFRRRHFGGPNLGIPAIVVDYVVEWLDQAKGQFALRIIGQ